MVFENLHFYIDFGFLLSWIRHMKSMLTSAVFRIRFGLKKDPDQEPSPATPNAAWTGSELCHDI
jgi:hypothetical protein